MGDERMDRLSLGRLLEPTIAAASDHDDAAINRRPDHLGAHQRLASERCEAAPRRRSQGVSELLTVRPQPDLARLFAADPL
jgi:transposase